jgi:hypothetical protein
MMRLAGLVLGCLGVALAVPASAQIIATSIPREDTGGGTGSNAEHRFALHLMASPFAKWKINSYVEEPKGSDFPDFQQAATTDSRSKFIGAAEVAFAAGSNWSVGVGGWFNSLGEPDVDIFELDLNNGTVFGGVATQKLRVSEVHGNLFYKDIGVQAGIVHTSATLTGFRAGSVLVDLISEETITFPRDITLSEAGVQEQTFTTNNWDAFLVYKHGGPAGSRTPWSVSLGGGVYRDTEAGETKPSAFATASVGIFRGLGIDASFWYVGGSKPTAARQELGDLLENAVSDNLSRFTIGVGYTFN